MTEDDKQVLAIAKLSNKRFVASMVVYQHTTSEHTIDVICAFSVYGNLSKLAEGRVDGRIYFCTMDSITNLRLYDD